MKVKRQEDHVIELGKASIATKGAPVGMDDTRGGRNPLPGLCDE